MNIGIIGAGNIGGNLTRRFSGLGHQVFVANSRGPESLADLAAETGGTPVSVTEAAERGDVVIVTIPEKNIPYRAICSPECRIVWSSSIRATIIRNNVTAASPESKME